MAVVPVSQPTVSPKSAGAGFTPLSDGGANPNAFGAQIGQAAMGVAANIGKDADVATTIATSMAVQQDTRAAKDADAAHQQQVTDAGFTNLPGGPEGNKGYFSLRGQAAVDALPTYQKFLQDTSKNFADGLEGPRARNMFDAQAQQRLLAEGLRSKSFATQQSMAADDQSSAARIGSYNDALTANYNDPTALGNFKAVTTNEMADQARRNGWSPEVLAQQTKAALSKGYKDAILAASSTPGGVPQAAQMFAKLGPEMDAGTHIAMAEHLKPLLLANRADEFLKGLMGNATPASGSSANVADAIHGQESNGKATSVDSIDGAKGGWQIMPATFRQYAKPGEDISNPAHNEAVGRRIIDDLNTKAGGDPARVAVGYFSGPGNMSAPGSALPYKEDKVDGNGFSTSRYVAGVLGRMNGATGQPSAPAGNASDANPAIHPDFAGMQKKVIDAFPNDHETQQATLARLHQAAGQYELSTQADRDKITKNWTDTVASLTAGNDTTPVSEATIRHVFRPDVADHMIGEANEARTAGQLTTAIKWASPEQSASIMQDLSSGLGPNATLAHLQGKKYVPIPGADGTISEDPAQFMQRQKALAAAQTAYTQKQKALAADPAAYVNDNPTVKAAFSYASANLNDPQAFRDALNTSMSVQRQQGVAPGDERALSVDQAAKMVKSLHETPIEQTSMGDQLNKLKQQYGDAYPTVVKDLARAGMNPDYQVLAHADLPTQATVREDLQRALQTYDGLKDKSEFGRAVPADQKPLLKPAIDTALADFRQTTAAYASGSAYDSVVYPAVEKLATYYAGRGMKASDAAEKASELVTKSYDFDGITRTPKGQLSAVQSAGRTITSGLTDESLSGTTAAEARRSGIWVTNPDDSGVTLMKGTLQGGYMTIKNAAGGRISMDFKNLPKGTAPTAPTAVDGGYNAGVN